MNNRFESPTLYLSAEHPCSYLPGARARTLFVDPDFSIDGPVYQILLDQGFRRSGRHVYRPHCRDCHACVPLRLPVGAFRPRRSQRRCWQNNHDRLEVTRRCPAFTQERFDLYRRYTRTRHTGGGMDDCSPEHFMGFLTAPWCETHFCEFRERKRLVAVAVTDLLPGGLSAVYSFFDPDQPAMSLGVYALLWQIAEARRLGLPWLYLGYWVRGCRKMDYKDQYRPVEAWTGSRWQRFDRGETIHITAHRAEMKNS